MKQETIDRQNHKESGSLIPFYEWHYRTLASDTKAMKEWLEKADQHHTPKRKKS